MKIWPGQTIYKETCNKMTQKQLFAKIDASIKVNMDNSNMSLAESLTQSTNEAIIFSYDNQSGQWSAVGEITTGPADNEIWYDTNNETFFDVKAMMDLMAAEITEIPVTEANVTSNQFDSTIGHYVIRTEQTLTSTGVIINNDQTRCYINPLFYTATNVTKIILPKTIVSLGGFSFSYLTSLLEVTIPSTVTEMIGQSSEGVFGGCTSLSSIQLPSSLKTLDYSVFRDCTSLSSIDIPAAIEKIGVQTFYGCSNLSSITVRAITPPTMSNDAFTNIAANYSIYVPQESLTDYTSKTGWSSISSHIHPIEL